MIISSWARLLVAGLLGSQQEEGVEVPVQGSCTRAATGMPEDTAAWSAQQLGSSQEIVDTEGKYEIEQLREIEGLRERRNRA